MLATTQPNIVLPHSASAVLATLEQAGFEAWVVGGCVRDALLGRPLHDIDLATNAHWKQVQATCEAAGMHTFETGVAHGTLSVQADGNIIEVTTYRNEGSYTDARHPDHVEFVQSIEQDLARRDFTMNALAWHPVRGLCDPYGGAADIALGSIRAVDTPVKRFSEDALRIVRAVRFASELGFAIDPATEEGANVCVGQLEKIAVERIAAELTRLLCGPHAGTVLLAYPTITDAVLPELAPMRGFDQKSPYHVYDVYEHTAHVVDGVAATPLLRWASLLHDSGKPAAFTIGENGQGHFYGHAEESAKVTRALFKRLKISPRFAHQVELLVRYHDMHGPATTKNVKRMVRNLDQQPELFRAWCALKRSDAYAHAPQFQQRAEIAIQAEALLDELLAAEAVFGLKDLAISGSDVLDQGVQAGPQVGVLLNRALNAVLEEEVANEKQALLNFLFET